VDLIKELQDFGCQVTILDPWADPAEVLHEYGLTSTKIIETGVEAFGAVVLAVAHTEFKSFPIHDFIGPKAVIFDVKGMFPNSSEIMHL
jgi:UDP-N-acetyl-D-galactosamine dehydrogenase